jgi:hypothetical protein
VGIPFVFFPFQLSGYELVESYAISHASAEGTLPLALAQARKLTGRRSEKIPTLSCEKSIPFLSSEKHPIFVILSEAKNLSGIETNRQRDSSLRSE